MSARRKPGDWVWLRAGAGFAGDSNRLKAQIQPEDDPSPCMICFSDCREWATLWTAPDPEDGGKVHVLCHVGECEMFDEPQGDR